MQDLSPKSNVYCLFLLGILTELHGPPAILLMSISNLIENLRQSLSLANTLGLSRQFIGRLRYCHFTSERLFDVLERWKEEKGNEATGKALHTVLGDIDLAQEIKEQLLSKKEA